MDNNIIIEKPETRGQGILRRDGKTISGFAFLYDVWSKNLGGYKEQVKSGAIDQNFLDNQDCFALLNHDKSKVLARSNRGKGTLKLIADELGLRYEFLVKNTALCNEVLQYIEDGELNESSYSFRVKSNQEQWAKSEGMHYRTILAFNDIQDVSMVWQGANNSTTCSSRYYIENILPTLRTTENNFAAGNKTAILQQLKNVELLEENQKQLEILEQGLKDLKRHEDAKQVRYLQGLKEKFLPEYQTAKHKIKMLELQNEIMKSKEYQDIKRNKK